MNPQENNSPAPASELQGEQQTQPEAPVTASGDRSVENGAFHSQLAAPQSALPGDPIDLASHTPVPWPSKPQVPDDLRISWSWLHLIAFILFGVFSFVVVQLSLLIHYVPANSLRNQAELERIVLSKPILAVGTMVIWYGLLILFLYVTLAVFQNAPFWHSLGWRKIGRRESRWPRSPWLYLGCGSVLSMVVFAVTAKMQPPENVPIEELFKYKNTAMMFMAMAVLVAPLVEETVFRGYLYPLFAKYLGVAASVALTGVLFGLMHGAQLGWTWELVTVLIVVGVVFTFVRARTGSVFASFLLHLGYNSMIAVFTFIGTAGFRNIPQAH